MIYGVDHKGLVDFVSMIVGRQDAEDVVQEAYVKLLSTTSKFEGRSTVKTWVYAVARNCAYDWLRMQGREVGFPDEDDAEGIPSSGSWDGAQMIEDSIDLDRAVSKLKPEYQAAVLSRMYCDSLAEAAALLGSTQQSVKARYRRALAQLRKELTRK